MAVLDTLKEVIVEVLDTDPDTITLASRFNEDLKASSLDVVEMLMLLEERLNIEFPEEKTEDMKTVGDVVAYIEQSQA